MSGAEHAISDAGLVEVEQERCARTCGIVKLLSNCSYDGMP